MFSQKEMLGILRLIMKRGELTYSHLIEGPKRLSEISSEQPKPDQRFWETYPSGGSYIPPLTIQPY